MTEVELIAEVLELRARVAVHELVQSLIIGVIGRESNISQSEISDAIRKLSAGTEDLLVATRLYEYAERLTPTSSSSKPRFDVFDGGRE